MARHLSRCLTDNEQRICPQAKPPRTPTANPVFLNHGAKLPTVQTAHRGLGTGGMVWHILSLTSTEAMWHGSTISSSRVTWKNSHRNCSIEKNRSCAFVCAHARVTSLLNENLCSDLAIKCHRYTGAQDFDEQEIGGGHQVQQTRDEHGQQGSAVRSATMVMETITIRAPSYLVRWLREEPDN